MKNRIQYALRNINRNRLNVAITTIGLSMALGSVLIIFLFIKQEHSYNNFHENADRIYRLNYAVTMEDGAKDYNDFVNPDLATDLEEKVPQIEHCSPFRMGYMAQLDLKEKNLKVELGIANQDFFSMFSFKLLMGNRNDLLTNPTNIVITKSLAQKISGTESPNYNQVIGQNLEFTFIKDVSFTVTGILDDIPKNSTLNFEAIIPFEHQSAFWQSNNAFGNSILFYELKKDVVPEQAHNQVYAEVREYYKDIIESAQKNNLLSASSDCFQAYSLPLKNLYLDDQVGSGYQLAGNKTQLKILTIVALLIFFIAFTNYVILTIGQFLKKAGEVSIRKSMGGKNSDIFKMFLSENFITILISFILGAILGYVCIPIFNNISNSQIYFNLIEVRSLLVFSALSIIALTTLTSLIPVFIFRKVKPSALSSSKLFSLKKTGKSQVFVGMQYALTIVLIIATIAIYKQTNFLKNRPLGFSDKNIISLDVRYLSQSNSVVLRDMLKSQSGVVNASLTNRDFFDGYTSSQLEIPGSDEIINTYIFKADQHFIPALNLKLLEGRNFSENDVSSTNRSIIINEEFARKMKIDGSPIGSIVKADEDKFKIIGVVNNYQFLTSREKIQPMILYSNTDIGNSYSSILIKYNPQNLSNIIAAIKNGWKEMGTKETLNYTFWDKELENRYQEEERLGKTILYASIIAIIILSLGLFGLTILISTQRTKEIGIRKVNGAKISEVMVMLNKDFVKWVAIAFVIATPIAWYALNKWLENFAYKTTLSWWIFAVAGLFALGIALLTVSFQSWKAAATNPVEALRYE